MSERPILTKRVNAFIHQATPTPGVRMPARIVAAAFRQALGGLWVGGTLELFSAEIAFKPNALNAALHRENLSLLIPLKIVSGIQHRPGLLTGIAQITSGDDVVSFRCFGATELVEKIRLARDRALGEA